MRQRWKAELRNLLEQTEGTQEFYSGMEQLLINPSSIYSEKYLERLNKNTDITIALIVLVIRELDDDQLEHLSNTIDSISSDFVQLACNMDGKEHQADANLSIKKEPVDM